MPERVLPDRISFGFFEQVITKQGFRRLTDIEFTHSFKRLGLQAPRPRPGREVGFVFSANGLTVFVWTTFLDAQGCARQEDAGWVLITQGDKARYFSHPMKRTKHFLPRLAAAAQIAKERILNRPLCPACKGYMNITYGTGLKSRYWQCQKNCQSLPWDYGLSEKAVKWLQAERKARRRYREARRKAGKTVDQAMLTRRPWKITMLENVA